MATPPEKKVVEERIGDPFFHNYWLIHHMNRGWTDIAVD